MNQNNKIRTFFYSSLALSAITTTLYAICYTILLDTPIAYFSLRSPIPHIAKYLIILNVAWILSIFIALPSTKTPNNPQTHSASQHFTSAIIVISFILYIALKYVLC